MATVVRPRILVVGGHSRNIGKTALVVDVIRAFPEAVWTAAKITQYRHGVCAESSAGCSCAPKEHTIALDEERDSTGATDTSRFLAAGAKRALWLRAKQGHLAEAMPLLRSVIADAENVILESNTVLQFLRPVMYLAVLDPRQADFKPSAKRALDRADALILRFALRDDAWPGISRALLHHAPAFVQPLGCALPGGLVALIRAGFFA
jgi:hypothetical protein